jgi:hypothetical protein
MGWSLIRIVIFVGSFLIGLLLSGPGSPRGKSPETKHNDGRFAVLNVPRDSHNSAAGLSWF